jgi:hypothetical protein
MNERDDARNVHDCGSCISLHRCGSPGIDLISDVLPYSPLWYAGTNAISNAISFAKFKSGSHNAVIRVYDAAGNVIETHEHAGEFKSVKRFARSSLGCRDRSSSLRIDNHSSQGCGAA